MPPRVVQSLTFLRCEKQHPSGYRQLTEDPKWRIQRFMTVQKTNDTATTRTTQCSDVLPNQLPKQHNSSSKRWEFVHRCLLLTMSINGALCRKFAFIQIKDTYGIAIPTSRTTYGTDMEWHFRTWHHQPEWDFTVYMLHHHLIQEQSPRLKHFSLWYRLINLSSKKWWSPRLQLYCKHGISPF